jgi:tRNA A37 N6-isopentenylltransferase MiaA
MTRRSSRASRREGAVQRHRARAGTRPERRTAKADQAIALFEREARVRDRPAAASTATRRVARAQRTWIAPSRRRPTVKEIGTGRPVPLSAQLSPSTESTEHS